MTCIVGLEHEGRVWIGADSAGTAGTSQVIRADLKAWTTGLWAFGFTSSFRMGQILRYGFTPPDVHTWDVDRYMATDFVAAVRAALESHGWLRSTEGQAVGGTFLAAHGDRLYCIQSDFQIERLHVPFNAIGCGADLAMGALHATQDAGLGPVDRIETALRAASAFSAGVAGPYTIVATEGAPA